MSALQQHKLFVFYLKWEGAMDRLEEIKIFGDTIFNTFNESDVKVVHEGNVGMW